MRQQVAEREAQCLSLGVVAYQRGGVIVAVDLEVHGVKVLKQFVSTTSNCNNPTLTPGFPSIALGESDQETNTLAVVKDGKTPILELDTTPHLGETVDVYAHGLGIWQLHQELPTMAAGWRSDRQIDEAALAVNGHRRAEELQGPGKMGTVVSFRACHTQRCQYRAWYTR